MKGLKLFINDWLHIAKHKQARIAVIILLLIPLLYAGMFLLGYWNPYGNLDKLPVAVVNQDKGAAMDGKTLHIGDDLIANLNKDKSLDFHYVTSDVADHGLKNGQYDLLVKIPEDFSQKVTTLMDEKPQAANLIYKTNPGNNFIAGQIGSAAISKLKDEVGNEITKSYTETLFTHFQQLSNGMAAAGNGASELNNGTKKAQDGLHSVQEGIDRLANGAASLSNGVKPLAEGQVLLSQSMLPLKEGMTALSSGINQLSDAHKKLEQGASNLAQGVDQLTAGATTGEKTGAKVLADAQGLTEQLRKYVQSHPDLEKDADLQIILQQASGLSKEAKTVHDGQGQLAQSIITLQAGQSGLSAGMNQFGEKISHAGSGSEQISAGLSQVIEGMSKWQKGFLALSGGITSLADGGRQLQTGTVPLANGMLQLVDGSGELSKSLAAAAQKTSGIHTSDSMLSMFSRPVQLVESQINAVPNYGTAMTPYFLTLGLFVGGLIASNIIPFNRRANPGVAGWTHFINKMCLFLSIALIQTAIVDLVILYGFKVQILSVPKFILLSAAASFTYTTCIFMLVTLLGALGRLAAIFLLVTQLASSGGTFPLQLASSFIRFIGKCLPMTYAVEGFRSVISTGDWAQYWHNTAALIGYMAVFVIISLSVILASNAKGLAMQPGHESHS